MKVWLSISVELRSRLEGPLEALGFLCVEGPELAQLAVLHVVDDVTLESVVKHSRQDVLAVLALVDDTDLLEPVIDAGVEDVLCLPVTDAELRARLRLARRTVERRDARSWHGVPMDTLIEFAGDTIEIVDRDYLFQYVNPAFEKVMGYSREETIGNTPGGLIGSGMHPPEFFAEIDRIQEAGGVWKGTLISRNKAGELLYLESTIAAVFDEAGEVAHRVAVKRDITERVRAEEALKASQERYQLAVQGTAEVIFDWQFTHDRFFLSLRWWNLVGLEPPPEVSGPVVEVDPELWLRRIHPKESARVREQLERFLDEPEQGEQFECEHRVSHADGSWRWVLVRAAIARAPETGAPLRMAGSLADITEVKHAQLESDRARDHAVQANRAKSQFMANMSHELRTPLNAIIGYSEMLREDAEDEGDTQWVTDLDKILTAARMLLGLINDVLDISKIEAGKMELFNERLDLHALLQELITSVEPLARRRGNTLTVDLPSDIPEVIIDRTKLQQVLLNLLSNAAKFTEDGTISLRLTLEEERLSFTVEDSGIGIAPEVLPRLFKPFVQGDASTTRKYGGTGLGLAISRRFAQMMGGELSVRSSVGKGSVFTVILPLRPEVAPSFDALVPTLEDEQRLKTGRGGTVLLIDDDREMHQRLRRALSRIGMRMVSAYQGEEGLALARSERPDLILLDVMMTGINGWEVLSLLKEDPTLQDIRVIMTSVIEDPERGFHLGASEFLVKPFSRERLVEVLQRFRRPLPPRSVLVVEDDVILAELIHRVLESWGWDVHLAAHGKYAVEALEAPSTSLPDVILLDLMMPEMDGFEFLEWMRQDPRFHAIPVVITTAKSLTPDERKLLEQATERILLKGSYQLDELLRVVERSTFRS